MSGVVHAADNLTTAQAHEDSPNPIDVDSEDHPSLIDVNGLGRPKEFSGKEEDFQQWSMEIQTFIGVVKESEVMLERAADQTMEITTTAIDVEFLLTEIEWRSRSTQPGVRLASYA